MDVHRVTDPRLQHGDAERLTGFHERYMRDQTFVEHFINRVAIVVTARGLAPHVNATDRFLRRHPIAHPAFSCRLLNSHVINVLRPPP
jgi:hypothetical protein